MPKLTMEDVDKKLDEIRTRRSPAQRPNVIRSILERMRVRQPARPRLPRLPRV